MDIQYIINDINSQNREVKNSNHNFLINDFNSVKSLDTFDLNIFDLNYIWTNNVDDDKNKINLIDDLINIKIMIKNSEKCKNIFIIPLDQEFSYIEIAFMDKFEKSINLRHMVKEFYNIISKNLVDLSLLELKYEITDTKIKDAFYPANFYFKTSMDSLTKSKNSNKTTTLKIDNTTYLTTLNFEFLEEDNFSSLSDYVDFNKIILFLEEINLISNKSIIPEWIHEINLLNDKEKKQEISNQIETIERAHIKIEDAQKILNKNLHFKSILYSTGNELVNVVFEILEKILDYNLSDFKDNNHEDFLIKKPDITFIGEIKGVNGSIKSANISQLEVHYRSYLDGLEEEKIEEKVKALLIINPNKNRKLEEREKVHQNQIDLATRNESLIIQTYDLLKIFEAFEQKNLTTEKIEEVFINKIGLLEFEKDFKK